MPSEILADTLPRLSLASEGHSQAGCAEGCRLAAPVSGPSSQAVPCVSVSVSFCMKLSVMYTN